MVVSVSPAHTAVPSPVTAMAVGAVTSASSAHPAAAGCAGSAPAKRAKKVGALAHFAPPHRAASLQRPAPLLARACPGSSRYDGSNITGMRESEHAARSALRRVMTLIDYDPFSAEVLDDPYPVYERLREESPVHHLEKYGAYALSRFEDIWQATQSPALSVAGGITPSNLLLGHPPNTRMPSQMDPPRHTEIRRLVGPHFRPSAAAALWPRS